MSSLYFASCKKGSQIMVFLNVALLKSTPLKSGLKRILSTKSTESSNVD